MPSLRPKLTFANAIALIALFVSLGGTVYAAAKINGKTIKKGSIPANRLKAESVGGAQLNEASLARVPSAQRAASAARAAEAEMAVTAERADEAARATSAAQAASADLAAEAEHAGVAGRAPSAADAVALAGLSGVSYRQSCGDVGGVKGFVHYDPAAADDHIVSRRNCGKGAVSVVPVGATSYDVTFAGLGESAEMALVSTFGFHSASAAKLERPNGVFRVTVLSTVNGNPLPNEPFTLVVF